MSTLKMLIVLLLPSSTSGCYVGCVTINVNCIANDTLVLVKNRGAIPAALVKPGDEIRGVRGEQMEPDWCKVIANPDHGYGRVVGDFTPGHMVAREDDAGNNLNIVPHEDEASRSRMTGLRNIATDCELAKTANGQLFSPFSDKFCNRPLSWADYRTLMSSVLALTGNISFVWDVRNWEDNATHPLFATLHRLCDDMISCAQDAASSASCSQFEATVDDLVTSNLAPSMQPVFRETWPNATVMTDAIHRKEAETAVAVLSVVSGVSLLACAALLFVVARLIAKLRKLRGRVEATETEVEKTKAAVKAIAAGEPLQYF